MFVCDCGSIYSVCMLCTQTHSSVREKNENVSSGCDDVLRPSQHFYRHIRMFLELNQHNAEDKLSCSRMTHDISADAH